MGTAYGVHSISEAPTTVHLHILPRLHTIQETGKRVAAIIKTGFTTGDWKSVGGLAPHAHCNLNSILLHNLNIKQIGQQLQLLFLMIVDRMLWRASEKEEKL